MKTGICWKALLLGVSWFALSLGGLSAAAADNEIGLVLDKESYMQGERISVTFTAMTNWPRDAWIGIVPAQVPHGSEAVNDQYDVAYQYIEKRSNGVLVFIAPEAGHWDMRMHDSDNNGREVASVHFTTVPDPTAGDAKLTLEKTVFAPGERINVTFRAPRFWPRDAWVGIVPSKVPHGSEAVNDQYDVAYRYIEKRTQGVLLFVAPGPGDWDVRMNDSDDNGREAAAVSFTVR